MESLELKKYTLGNPDEVARLHTPRYAYSLFRDIDLRGLSCCKSILKRGEITAIESFPKLEVDSAAMMSEAADFSVRALTIERVIPAAMQAETIHSMFGQEGVVVFQFDGTQAELRDLYEVGEKIAQGTLEDARRFVYDVNIRGIKHLRTCVENTAKYANSVISLTKQEITRARNGRGGKAFLDSVDRYAMRLMGLSERSVLMDDGSENKDRHFDSFISQLTEALTNKGASSQSDFEMRLQINALQEQIHSLTEALSSKKRVAGQIEDSTEDANKNKKRVSG